MTNTPTKILFSVCAFIFFVIFAGVGVAALFDKSVVEKTVKTITNKITEEVTEEDGLGTENAPVSGSTGATPTTPSNATPTTTPKATTPTTTPAKTTLTAALVATHNKAGDCWIILSGSVYNISSYSHSGGASRIQCGSDQTSAIHAKHGTRYDSYFSSFKVGALGSQI